MEFCISMLAASIYVNVLRRSLKVWSRNLRHRQREENTHAKLNESKQWWIGIIFFCKYSLYKDCADRRGVHIVWFRKVASDYLLGLSMSDVNSIDRMHNVTRTCTRTQHHNYTIFFIIFPFFAATQIRRWLTNSHTTHIETEELWEANFGGNVYWLRISGVFYISIFFSSLQSCLFFFSVCLVCIILASV